MIETTVRSSIRVNPAEAFTPLFLKEGRGEIFENTQDKIPLAPFVKGGNRSSPIVDGSFTTLPLYY